MAYLWGIFLRLHNRRSAGFGPNPLLWSDIAAFSNVTRTPLHPWEIEVIEMLDDVFLTAGQGGDKHQPKPERNVSVERFDALFGM